MGNSLDAHRAAIVFFFFLFLFFCFVLFFLFFFYIVSHRRVKLPENLFHLNFKFHFYCIVNLLCLLSLTTSIKHDQYAFFKRILLIISMDVELNPGPITSDRSRHTH